jgi:hypothetical protein
MGIKSRAGAKAGKNRGCLGFGKCKSVDIEYGIVKKWKFGLTCQDGLKLE